MNAGSAERYGASLNTKLSAWSGTDCSLKNSLMPSARDWSTPNGPGALRADPVLHVGDDLAQEPDVEQDEDEQQREDDDRLADDDEHDADRRRRC